MQNISDIFDPLTNINNVKKIILLMCLLLNMTYAYSQDWNSIKDTVSPVIEIPSEYDSIYRQPLSGLGWEDGLHISDDGLNLYCTYVPIDLLSFSLNGDLPNSFSSNYLRGAPDFGMDLISNPISASEWLHSDILYANRTSIIDSFGSWQLSNMARSFYSEGAPTPIFGNGSNSLEMMLFTSNDNPTNNMDIWVINNTSYNPTGTGAAISSPINSSFNEDNPNLTKITEDSLIMFYDSDNLPGGNGDIDLWYTISVDGGINWNNPINVSSINTNSKEHQPFLHYDLSKGKYFLYYSTYHTDGKLAIFRREQSTPNDWDSWGSSELVISAGNSAGIGEPTLTTQGDISFVVVYEDPMQTSIYDRFDSDPWFLTKVNTITGVSSSKESIELTIFPNPSEEMFFLDYPCAISQVQIINIVGVEVYSGNEAKVDISEFPDGIYIVNAFIEKDVRVSKLLIKK